VTSSDQAMSAPALAASRTATRGIALMSALVRAVRTRHPRIQLLRGAIFTFSAALFTIALGLLPIAEATTIAFVSPLIVSILAGPVLGERVGWSRWLAVLTGFSGVLVIAWPTGQGFASGGALSCCGTRTGVGRPGSMC